MTLHNALLFDPQCCDAVGYLEMGLRCATEGNCYDTLRPLGIIYWFSLPYRLGIAPEWLIVLQGAMLLLSIVLGALAMHSWWLRRHQTSVSYPARTLCALLLCSLLAHVIWFYPLLRLSLSDMPASLMALIGIWLICLSRDSKHVGLQCLAGLCLGIACSMRAFFLYPLFGMLILWLLLTLARGGTRPLRDAVLAILSALIPVCLQYSATYQQSGIFSYLDNNWSSHWSSKHLDDNASGYDTASFGPYRWYQSPCRETAKSVSLGIAERDPASLTCLLMGRLYFYLGSYSSKVFHYGEHDNLLPPPPVSLNSPLLSIWQSHGLKEPVIENHEDIENMENFIQRVLVFLARCEQMPAHDQACQSSSLSEGVIPLDVSSPTREGYVEYRVPLPAEQAVTFSAVAIAQSPMQVVLSIIDEDNQLRASQLSSISAEPTFISVTGIPLTSATHRVRISLGLAGTNHEPVSNHQSETDKQLLVALWAIRAELGGVPAVLEKTSLSADRIRYWSPWLLAINVFMLASAYIAVLRWRTALCPAEWSALFFLVLSIGLSIIIVPEQRFFVTPMVVLWTLAGLGIISTIGQSRHA